jgi:hypothetical protein
MIKSWQVVYKICRSLMEQGYSKEDQDFFGDQPPPHPPPPGRITEQLDYVVFVLLSLGFMLNIISMCVFTECTPLLRINRFNVTPNTVSPPATVDQLIILTVPFWYFLGAMLVHPRLMCPRPKILGCCIPWTKCPLTILPLTERSHPFDLIERSDTWLPTSARFSAAKRWSSMCGLSVHPMEGRQSNKHGQGRRRSQPDAPLIH